jgi:hypothetical protein
MRTKHILFVLLSALCLVTVWAQPFDADIRQTADYKQGATWVPVLLRDNAAKYRTNLGVTTNILSFTTNGQVIANTGTNVLTFTNTPIILTRDNGDKVSINGSVIRWENQDRVNLEEMSVQDALRVYDGGSNYLDISPIASVTRTNLGLGWSALTNTNSATELLGVNTNGQVIANTGTNVLTMPTEVNFGEDIRIRSNKISGFSQSINFEEQQFQDGTDNLIIWSGLDITLGRAIGFVDASDAAQTRTNLGLGNGITTNRTFVSYNGTNYTTNSVTISNGIITGWAQ